MTACFDLQAYTPRAGITSEDGSPTFWKEQNASMVFEHKDFTSCLVSVPLTIEYPSGTQDTAALVAGMLGFTVHRTDTSDEVTV